MTTSEVNSQSTPTGDTDVCIGTDQRSPMTTDRSPPYPTAASNASSIGDRNRTASLLCFYRDTRHPAQRTGSRHKQWRNRHKAHSATATRVSSIRLQ
jgi:hypothetical protein